MVNSHDEDQYISFTLGEREPPSNMVRTNNYTYINFLPKFLYAQFKQVANLFFLVLSVIQSFPGLSPFGRQATLLPLSFIIGTSAIREIYEDLRRRIRDRKMNYQKCYAHTSDGWRAIPWCELHVGQLIRAVNGEQLAADCLILATSEPGSVAYVETANLDGESSLKVRQAAPTRLTNSERSMNEFWQSGVEIVYDAPNGNIYEFQGHITGRSNLLVSLESTSLSTDTGDVMSKQKNSIHTIPLTNAHVILRGARLKNTDNIYGIVLYTGQNTKLFKNSTKRIIKSSELGALLNSIMLTQFGIVMLLCLWHSIMSRLNQPVPWLVSQFSDHYDDSLMSIFLQHLVLFSGFIPISLYVTLELVQIIQGTFIHNDEMMADENGRGPDVKMFSLNSELGDVKYVMSDKTGTLTQNCMRFRMCSVGGVKYANRRSRRDKVFSPKKLLAHMASNQLNNADQIREFLLACALCHTASPDKNTSTAERPLYHATSPDEHALLKLAADAGFVFKRRAPGKCYINALGVELEYDLVAVLEFDSERKRMSVIVKDPHGKYKLYIKGADQKIFERLKSVSQKELKRTAGHLQQFALGGLRTLCFAVRTIEASTITAWHEEYIKTVNDSIHRKTRLAELAEAIEKELVLVGVSAIEDRLQKRVPETVGRLVAAGIRVWVLTGDKLETAVNIGNSCHLLSARAPMMVLSSTTAEGAKKELAKYLGLLGEKMLARRDQQIALVVDATCLDFILIEEVDRDEFLRLALCCSTVICCRCTPIQKAAVTRLLKANVCGAILAIGDGANDVAMLQEANVGVGISGQEGMQAALASDYTISQFHHLDRLLFVHGTLSLFRTSKCILFSLYKNVLETCVLSFYTYLNGHSVQTIADEWTVLFYNMFFTSFPALIMGIIDRPAPIGSLIKYPRLYPYYQNSLSNWSQFRWCTCAALQAVVIFSINVWFWGVGAPLHAGYGADSTLWAFGFFIYFSLVLIVNLKSLLETNSITMVSLGTAIFSLALLLIWVLANTFFNHYLPLIPRALGGILFMIPVTALVFVVVLVAIATLLPDIAVKVFRRALRADMQDAMLWQEGIRGTNFNILYQPIFKMCDIVGLRTYGELESNRYGFAFAQDDGLAVTQMDLLREHSTESLSLRTADVGEFSDKFTHVKANERSVDDKTVVSSMSGKSPKSNETAEPTKSTL
ncbi:Phospholipid-transporting ATPase [Trichostrongylus colubriformis]|uniref:Phospholipid-transporting ATPase n=1 Tax=Trichostrongylus colubriformis TaxID=6319 RepID=A0AAN8G3C6_TRICO